jgi:AcrR family transcriptional regulator
MSLIAKRARASAGIIYHYFDSKEDLLSSLYLQIKGELGRAIVAADNAQQPLAKRFQTLWLSMFQYCLDHPREMAFLEQYESRPMREERGTWLNAGAQTLDAFVADAQSPHLTASLPLEARTLVGLIADLRAQDLVKDLPVAVIGELTLGTATRLARQASAGKLSLDEDSLAGIAKACWDAIAH